MTGLKQHGQHLAPQICRLQSFGRLDQALLGLCFVVGIGLLKLTAEFIVQVRCGGRGEQCPFTFFHHAAHEQVGDPVGGVHVMGAAAIVPGVFAQLQKLFNVQVPSFQVGANSAFALTALVDSHRGVVDDLKKGNNALRFAIGAFDV